MTLSKADVIARQSMIPACFIKWLIVRQFINNGKQRFNVFSTFQQEFDILPEFRHLHDFIFHDRRSFRNSSMLLNRFPPPVFSSSIASFMAASVSRFGRLFFT